MERIKSAIKVALKEKYLVQVCNYKLAIYQHEKCERTLQMHLFTLEKRDFTLIVILTIAFSVFSLMLASIWPLARDFQTKANYYLDNSSDDEAIKIVPWSSIIENNTVILSSPDSNDDSNFKSNQNNQDRGETAIELNKILTTDILTTGSIYCLNKEFFINVNLNFQFQVHNQKEPTPRSETINSNSNSNSLSETNLIRFNISYQLDWNMVPLESQSVKFYRILSATTTTGFRKQHQQSNGVANKSAPGGAAAASSAILDSSIRKLQADSVNNRTIHLFVECGTTKEFIDKSKTNHQGRLLSFKKDELISCKPPVLSIKQSIKQPKRKRYLFEINLSNIKIIKDRRDKSSTNNIEMIKLKSINFVTTLSYMSSIFRALVVFSHMLYFCLTLWVLFWFLACLNEYAYSLWSIEQKCTAIQFILLVCTNTPLSLFEAVASNCNNDNSSRKNNDRDTLIELINPMEKEDYLTGSGLENQTANHFNSENKLVNQTQNNDNSSEFLSKVVFIRNRFGFMESILNLTFYCSLLLSWLVFAHSLRQISRPFWLFYAPKLANVGIIWLLAALVCLVKSENSITLIDSILAMTNIDINYFFSKVEILFYISLLIYFANLCYNLTVSSLELHPISYLRLRFRVQLVLTSWMLMNYLFIVIQEPYNIITNISDNDDRKYLRSSKAYCNLQMLNETSGHLKLSKKMEYSLDRILGLLPHQHSFDSSRLFLHNLFLNNLYILISAYLCWPLNSPKQQARGSRQNSNSVSCRNNNQFDDDDDHVDDCYNQSYADDYCMFSVDSIARQQQLDAARITPSASCDLMLKEFDRKETLADSKNSGRTIVEEEEEEESSQMIKGM